MKTFTKHILLLALMLFGVAGAAWALPRAPQKFTSAVNLSVLQEGDTLAEGASITFDIGNSGWSRTMGVVPNRAKKNGGPIPDTYAVEINKGSIIGAGGVIINDDDSFTPVTQSGDDGDAWVVTYLEVDGENENIDIEISGVLLPVPAPTGIAATRTAEGNWTFTMPGYNAKLVVTYKALPGLAWTYNSAAMPAEGLTAYRGFELPVIQNIRLQVSDTFNNAMQGYFQLDQVSAPWTWKSITDDNFLAADMDNFVDNSSLTEEQVLTFPNPDPGTDNVYLIYGFDGYAVKYVLFNGANVTAASQGLTKSNIYYIIDEGAKIFYTTSTVVRGLTLRYGSSNPAVVSFSNPNNMSTFSVNGAGEADIYAVFDGDTTFLYDSVAFHVTIAEPATLTLAANGQGTVSALVGGGEETLLTTITATGLSDYSQSPDGIVTVTLNNISNYSSDFGWIENGTVTVEAPQGYTITRCVFRQYDKTPLEDDQAPFTATMADYIVSAVTSTGQVYGVDVLSGDNMDGISSIEVYGYATGSNSIVVLDETAGTYAVIPGAEVQVVATAQDGNYVQGWNEIDKAVTNVLSDTATIVVNQSQTLTATFAQNPLLTLATDGQWGTGTVSLDGVTYDTVYNITFDHQTSQEGSRSFTIPASRLPYDTTFIYYDFIEEADASEPSGKLSISNRDNYTVTIRISGAFEGQRSYQCSFDGMDDYDGWLISCVDSIVTVYPDGIAATETENTYRVLPGTQLSVTATPEKGYRLAQWSDQTEPVEGDARLGGSHPYTMPATAATLTATFVQNPLLILTSNNSEWGTVTLDGVTPGATTYNITISENPYPDVTYTNVTFPFHTTVFLHEDLDGVEAVDQTPLIAVKNGDNADITINGPYGGTIEYSYNNHEGTGHKAIFCDAVPGLPIMPEGVTYAGYDNYLVLPGTEVTVVAAPDTAYYFKNWTGEADAVSNEAVVKTLTMGETAVELTANFQAKPTLTLAQTAGGTLEAIVPQGAGEETLLTTVTATSLTTYDETTPGIVTVSLDNIPAYNSNWGWGASGSVTVEAAQGYTITRCVFKQNPSGTPNRVLVDDLAPFTATMVGNLEGGTDVSATTTHGDEIGDDFMAGISSIEVYGYQNVAANVVRTADPNTYIIDYGTPVTVVATPDDQHYLVSFSDDDPATERNSNIAVEKTYDSVIADLPLSATFAAKPQLILTANDGGTLTLDGYSPAATTYNITIEGGNTYTNVTFPFQTTVFLHDGLYDVGSGQYPLSAVRDGNSAAITISEPYGGDRSVSYTYIDNENFISGHKNISCQSVESAPIIPAGVVSANATLDTFVVDYGTDVTVTATPDSIHYLKNFSGFADTNSNTAVAQTYTITENTTATANFQAKPQLTLAHNDGGEMEIVPEEVMAVNEFTIPSSWNNDNTLVAATDLPSDFQSVSEAKARAWQNTTGHPVYLFFKAYAGGTVAYVRFNANGTVADISTGLKSVIYNNVSDVYEGYLVRYTTVGYDSNFIASTTEPNTYYIDYNTDVTVKAMPAEHYHLQGWSNNVTDNGDSTATLTLTQDETVSATFAQNAPELAWEYDDETLANGDTISAYHGFEMDSIANLTYSSNGEFFNADQNTGTSLLRFGSSNTNVVSFADAFDPQSLSVNAPGTATVYMVHDGSVMAYDSAWFTAVILAPDTLALAHNEGGEMTVETLTDSIRAIVTDTTYAVVPGANVTVVAMPDSAHYLVNWDNDAAIYSNTDTTKHYVVNGNVTATATFNIKPTLTLAQNENWGTVMLEGAGSGSSNGYTIKFSANGNTIVKENVTLPKTYQCEYGSPSEFDNIIRELYGWTGVHGNENAIPTVTGTDAITPGIESSSKYPKFTINSAFQGTATVTIGYTNSSWVSDNWPIEISFVPALPAGVAQLDSVTYRVDYGTEVTVNAEATELHHVAGWQDEADNAYSAAAITYDNYAIIEPANLFPALSTLTLTVTADTTTEVLFGINSYDVAATAQLDSRAEIGTGLAMGRITAVYADIDGNPQSAGPDDTLTYTAQGGSQSTLTATANYGYLFAGWYDANADTLMSDLPVLNLTEAYEVEARFVPDTFEVSYTQNIATAGTIEGADRYPYLTNMTLVATPATGYHFVNWKNEEGDILGTAAELPIQVLRDSAITAILDTNVYDVVANVNIEGLGTVTGAGEVKHFLSTTLVATANVKYHFVKWINAAGDSVSANTTIEVFPVGDTTLTAVFDTNIYATVWSGETDTTYTSLPYTGLTATYTDFWGNEHTPVLTFVCGSQTVVTPNYPVTAGTWTVTATPEVGDSLTSPVTTLTINRAIVNITGATVETAKFYDENTDAVVTNAGTLNNVQGSDAVTHTTTASYSDATVGDGKTITVNYTLHGTSALLANYTLTPASEEYTTNGAIIEPMEPRPDEEFEESDTTEVDNGFEVYAYGYCTGTSYRINYQLRYGYPDQYKLDFTDSRFTDVDWTNLPTAGRNGHIDIDMPVDLPTGDYTVTVTFRDSRYMWLESTPLTVTFHVNLPETYTRPLFKNVIALVDTCHCFTDIQWYYRADATQEWAAIPGATGYYYHANADQLDGQFFVKAKMNGVETFTCPQTDVETLITDEDGNISMDVFPNPTTDRVTVTVNGSQQTTHTLRILNTLGVELENGTFEGDITTIDFSRYQRGSYMVSVDGTVVRVIRN